MNFMRKILPLSFTFDKSLALLITGILLYLNLSSMLGSVCLALVGIPVIGAVIGFIISFIILPLIIIYSIVGIVFLLLSYFKKV